MAKKVQNMLIEVPTDNYDIHAVKDFIKTSRNQLDPAPREDGIEKRSEVFMRFVQPLLSDLDNEKDMRTVLGFAILGWNIALTPRLRRIQLMAKGLNIIPIEERLEYKKRIELWVNHKEAEYAEYEWKIFDFDLKYSTKGVALTVITTNLPENM